MADERRPGGNAEPSLSEAEVEKKIKDLENNIFKVVNFYFTFLGVILAAVLNASLECDDMWIVFTLFGSVAFLALAALGRMGFDLAKLLREKSAADEHLELMKAAGRRPNERHKPYVGFRPGYYVGYSICIAFFLLFTGFVFYGAHWKNCGKGHAKSILIAK